MFNAGPPTAVPMNIRISQDNITNESFVVLWDAVNDIFPINYTIRWYGEDGSNGTATINGLSYTVTGLTANTSYNVTVVVISTCCGAGPVSNVVMTMTKNQPPTLPPPAITTTATTTTTTTAITATVTPTSRNILIMLLLCLQI